MICYMDIIRLTCNIDINCRESGKRHRGHILRSNPKREDGRGLVVQRLGHQNGRWAVLAVGREVETNRHIGFGDRAILQVIGHPRITQLRGRLDGLDRVLNQDFAWLETCIHLFWCKKNCLKKQKTTLSWANGRNIYGPSVNLVLNP